MRNYFFYILFICAFTNSFGKNENKKKSSGKKPEPVKQSSALFEAEAKKDIENLLLNINNRNNFSEEDDPEPFTVDAPRSNTLMERLDNISKKSKSVKKHNKNLRTNAQINADNFKRGVQIQNLPFNLRNAIESSSSLHYSDSQLMNKVAFHNGGTIKSRISGGHNVNTMLRSSVNYINIKPEVYPILITDDKYGSRELTTEKNIVRINNQYYTNDEDELTKLAQALGNHRSRNRRSSGTQAGYTQHPDTCKTYNENLAKLWSNLSKLINIKDQPNDKALHNIAMIIQAYLEHQNAKKLPETHKAKHEGPKGKMSEIMLKIRKLLDEAEGSAEKITKIILKNLKPDYKNVESEDCQQVNEEYLTLSIDLLYKNYLEKTECQGEDEGMTRNKKVILRERKVKKGKPHIGHLTLSMANGDYKPDFQNLLMENESYENSHKGKTQRQRSPNKNRRVFKTSIQQRLLPAYRSGNQNENDNLNRRAKSSSKSTSKKHKKTSLKSDVEKSICETYATRKLVVSLRPVMERFMGLLECQLDNTLRSNGFGGHSEESNHLYASKFYSNEDSQRHRKVSPRFPVKYTGRNINKSHKKLHLQRHRDRDDKTDSAWVRKYRFDKTKSTNSESHAETRDTDARVSNNDNYKHHSNKDYDTNYNEYVQSPPPYDDYDEIYNTQQNAFPSLINPSISINKKRNTPSKSRSNNLVSSGIGVNENNYDYEDAITFYGLGSISHEETQEEFFLIPATETSTKHTPFVDLTKLRSDDQLIEEKNQIHAKTFESITEFLKRARDESLKTPEFAVPFALDTNKGYVELTHLIKYPKMLVYRPQFLVKNTMPYDDFLKTINNRIMTNDNVRLMKILRHLPNGSVQVLFETEDSESPLEIRYLNDKDNKRSESPNPEVDFPSESRIDTAIENNNADLTNGNKEDFSSNSRNEALRQDFKSPVKSYSSSSDEYLSPDLDLNTVSDSLRDNEELSQNSYLDDNSDTNSTSNSKPKSSESDSSWFSPLSSLSANHPSPDFGKEMGSAVGSQIGAGIEQGSGTPIGTFMQMGLNTALNLGSKLNPMYQSQLGSFFSKLIPSHSNAQTTSNPSLNSQSHMNSHFDSPSGSYSASNPYSHLNSHSGLNPSHSLLPNSDSNNQEVGKHFSSSTQSIVLQWWRKWKNMVKGKMKQIIGKMGNLADNFDRIVTP